MKRYPPMEQIIKASEIVYTVGQLKEIDRHTANEWLKNLGRKKKILFLILMDGAKHFADSFLDLVAPELKLKKVKFQILPIKINSYGDRIEGGSPVVSEEILPKNLKISEWHVVLLEDIVDRGITIQRAHRHYIKAKSVMVVTRFDKTSNRKVKLSIPIIAGTIIKAKKEKDYFLFGAGMDLFDLAKYRKLRLVYKIHREMVKALEELANSS